MVIGSDTSSWIGFAASDVAAFIPLTSNKKPRLSSPLQPAGGAAWTGVSIVDHNKQVIVNIKRKCGSVLRTSNVPPQGLIKKKRENLSL